MFGHNIQTEIRSNSLTTNKTATMVSCNGNAYRTRERPYFNACMPSPPSLRALFCFSSLLDLFHSQLTRLSFIVLFYFRKAPSSLFVSSIILALGGGGFIPSVSFSMVLPSMIPLGGLDRLNAKPDLNIGNRQLVIIHDPAVRPPLLQARYIRPTRSQGLFPFCLRHLPSSSLSSV